MLATAARCAGAPGPLKSTASAIDWMTSPVMNSRSEWRSIASGASPVRASMLAETCWIDQSGRRQLTR